MVMAFDERSRGSKPVEVNEHTAPVDRSELEPKDIEDLRWLWNDHEAECGIRSSFGAQRERAAAIRAAAEAAEREDAKHERYLRKAAKERRELVRQTHGAAAHGGVEYQLGLDDERALIGVAISFERVRGHELHPATMPDLYDPAVMYAVQRARRIRETLSSISEAHVLVLFACYGPHRDDFTMRTREKPGQSDDVEPEDRDIIRESLTRTIRQRFSVELAELVVASVRAAGEVHNQEAAAEGKAPPFGDHEARRAVIARSKRAEFVRMQKVRAEKLIEAAGHAYATAKVDLAIDRAEAKRTRGRKWHCEPVYGPGEPGFRSLLGFRWT